MKTWSDLIQTAIPHDDPRLEFSMVCNAQRHQAKGWVPVRVARYERQVLEDHPWGLPNQTLVEIDFEPGVTARTFADWWAENKIAPTLINSDS